MGWNNVFGKKSSNETNQLTKKSIGLSEERVIKEYREFCKTNNKEDYVKFCKYLEDSITADFQGIRNEEICNWIYENLTNKFIKLTYYDYNGKRVSYRVFKMSEQNLTLTNGDPNERIYLNGYEITEENVKTTVEFSCFIELREWMCGKYVRNVGTFIEESEYNHIVECYNKLNETKTELMKSFNIF